MKCMSKKNKEIIIRVTLLLKMADDQIVFDYEPLDIESLDDHNKDEAPNLHLHQIPKEDNNDRLNKKEEINSNIGVRPQFANKPSSDLQNFNTKMFTYDKSKGNDDDILELIDHGNDLKKEPLKPKESAENDLFDDMEEDVIDLEDANKGKSIKQAEVPQKKESNEKGNKDKEDDDSYKYEFEDIVEEDNSNNRKKEMEKETKQKEEHEPLFLTVGKEPSHNSSCNKQLNYDELLNNDTFKKQTKPAKESVHKSSQSQHLINFDEESSHKEQPIPKDLKPSETNDAIINKRESNKDNTSYHPFSNSLGKPSGVLSVFEQSKLKYSQLKIEIEKLLTSSSTLGTKQLATQNVKMLQFLSNLNEILTTLTDHTRIPIKKQSLPNKESLQKASVNNDKILERYKHEYLKLKARLNQISDTSYENKINDELTEVKTQIAYYEKENKNLKTTQKISEIILENQAKDPAKTHMKLKRIEMDYESIKNQYEVYTKKAERNKQTVKENEARIKELSDWKGRLEEKARDMYGITVFENVVLEEKKEKEKREKISKLQKKIDVIDGSIESNKRKYEQEIVKNEREIFQKEEEKLDLLKLLNEKRVLSENCSKMIKAIYEPTILLQQKNESQLNSNSQREHLPLTYRDEDRDKEASNTVSPIKETTDVIDHHITTSDKPNLPVRDISPPECNVNPVQRREEKKDKLILKDNIPERQLKYIEKPNPFPSNDCIFPKIEPRNQPIGTNDKLNINPSSSNVNIGHNPRKPNFAFGFKKNALSSQRNFAAEKDDQMKLNSEISHESNINHKIIDENIYLANDDYSNKLEKRIKLNRQEEEVKRDIDIEDESNQFNTIPIKETPKNQTSVPDINKARIIPLTDQKGVNEEPEFLRDTNNNQPKRIIPSFLEEEDLKEDVKEVPSYRDSNHLINIGKLNIINNNLIQPKEDSYNRQFNGENLPERKRATLEKEKSKPKEEKTNEDAFDALLKLNIKPTSQNANKPVPQPYDEFADLEEFII